MAPRESPPSPASLSGEVRAWQSRKGTTRYREIRRFRAEDFGRVDLPRLSVRAEPEARRRKALGSRIKLQAGNGKRMKPFSVLRKEPQARPSWSRPVVDRTDARKGVTEVKSPRHLKLRWRSPDSSGGGERVARVSQWHEGRQGRSAGVSGVTPRSVCSRDSDVTEPTRRHPVRGGGHRPECPTSSGVGGAFHPSCSHTTRTSGTVGPSLADGRDGGFERVRH